VKCTQSGELVRNNEAAVTQPVSSSSMLHGAPADASSHTPRKLIASLTTIEALQAPSIFLGSGKDRCQIIANHLAIQCDHVVQ
jgi:hypothetical protein